MDTRSFDFEELSELSERVTPVKPPADKILQFWDYVRKGYTPNNNPYDLYLQHPSLEHPGFWHSYRLWSVFETTTEYDALREMGEIYYMHGVWERYLRRKTR